MAKAKPSTTPETPAAFADDCGVELAAVTPSPDPLDPHASVADCLTEIASVFEQVTVIGAALRKHCREAEGYSGPSSITSQPFTTHVKATGDHALHGRLRRLEGLCGEFLQGLQAHVQHRLLVGPHSPRGASK